MIAALLRMNFPDFIVAVHNRWCQPWQVPVLHLVTWGAIVLAVVLRLWGR